MEGVSFAAVVNVAVLLALAILVCRVLFATMSQRRSYRRAVRESGASARAADEVMRYAARRRPKKLVRDVALAWFGPAVAFAAPHDEPSARGQRWPATSYPARDPRVTDAISRVQAALNSDMEHDIVETLYWAAKNKGLDRARGKLTQPGMQLAAEAVVWATLAELARDSISSEDRALLQDPVLRARSPLRH